LTRYEVIIIGGGPAGLTAGLYTSRAGLKSLLVERGALGGQMMNATLVENYPGFPEGISGSELGSLMRRQAARYGLEVVTAEVTGLTQGQPYSISTTEGNFDAIVIIIAAGSEYRKLGVAGEKRLSGRGVSYCATCDGFFFRNREIAVVGGGDTAITDALELTQYASKVYVNTSAGPATGRTVASTASLCPFKAEVHLEYGVEEVLGEKMVNGLKLRDVKTGQESILKVDGVFVAIGLTPNSQIFSNILELENTGYITTDERMATSAPGILAAGDIRQNSPRQIGTAVGDGVTAAISAFNYLQETGKSS